MLENTDHCFACIDQLVLMSSESTNSRNAVRIQPVDATTSTSLCDHASCLQFREDYSMQLKGMEAVSVVHQIRCDRCDKEALRGEPGFAEMTSIGFDAGYDSIFGDGNRVKIDLCEPCLWNKS